MFVLSKSAKAGLYAGCGVVFVFLVLPVLIVVPMSFSGSAYLEFPPPSFSLRWYRRLGESELWLTALSRSLQLSVATVVLAVPVGVAAAYAVHHGVSRFARAVSAFAMLPLMVPHIIVATGVFFLAAKFALIGSFTLLLAINVMLALPIVFVTALAGIRAFDARQEMVARSLGAGRFEAFRKVTLPQISGSIGAAVVFAFVSALDEAVIALFIASGPNMTITKVMFTSLRDEMNPTLAAVSSVLVAISVAVTLAMKALGARKS